MRTPFDRLRAAAYSWLVRRLEAAGWVRKDRLVTAETHANHYRALCRLSERENATLRRACAAYERATVRDDGYGVRELNFALNPPAHPL